jgi:hypothetical protein
VVLKVMITYYNLGFKLTVHMRRGNKSLALGSRPPEKLISLKFSLRPFSDHLLTMISAVNTKVKIRHSRNVLRF